MATPPYTLDKQNLGTLNLDELNIMLAQLFALAGSGSPATALVTDSAPGAGAITNYTPAGFDATTGRLDVAANDAGTQLNDLPVGTDAQRVRVRNTGLVGELGLNNAVAGSTAAKRFSGAGNVGLPPGDSVDVVYYAGSVNRWTM